MDVICFDPALPGLCPFYKDEAGAVVLDGQNNRMMDFGHTFDADRGYRVFFKFRDSVAANSWGHESLLKWLDFSPIDGEQAELQRIAGRMARQVIIMNREWERLGRPSGGIRMDVKGSA